jgi:hypothetical protein
MSITDPKKPSRWSEGSGLHAWEVHTVAASGVCRRSRYPCPEYLAVKITKARIGLQLCRLLQPLDSMLVPFLCYVARQYQVGQRDYRRSTQLSTRTYRSWAASQPGITTFVKAVALADVSPPPRPFRVECSKEAAAPGRRAYDKSCSIFSPPVKTFTLYSVVVPVPVVVPVEIFPVTLKIVALAVRPALT